jgi:hypothetical protein
MVPRNKLHSRNKQIARRVQAAGDSLICLEGRLERLCNHTVKKLLLYRYCSWD